MKDRTQKRLTQTSVALLALAVVLTVLGPVGIVAAVDGLTVSQEADNTTVDPGDTITFTVDVGADESQISAVSIGLQEDLPDGWTVDTRTAGDEFITGPDGWLWFGGSSGVSGSDTVTYTVDVPNDAQPGEYTVGMTASTEGGESTTDQTTITVQDEQTNTAPTADAGPDQTVDENAQVVLNGQASSDADGSIASYSWSQVGSGPSVSLSGADTATPSFTAPDVDSDETLTFELEVTDDEGATDTDTVSVTVSDDDAPTPPAGTVDVSLSPDSETVTTGGQTTFDVVVSNVDGGVGAIDLTVSTDDASTLEIVDIDSPAAVDSEDIDVAADGSSASIAAYGIDTDDTGSVVVATVTVEGAAVGTADLSVDVSAIGTESGQSYTVGESDGAAVEVIDLPALDDSYAGPPQDLDGDGLYEDVNGDGTVDASDVQALFLNRNADAVTQNADLFDYNSDGKFDVVDIQMLFTEVFG